MNYKNDLYLNFINILSIQIFYFIFYNQTIRKKGRERWNDIRNKTQDRLAHTTDRDITKPEIFRRSSLCSRPLAMFFMSFEKDQRFGYIFSIRGCGNLTESAC